jgi:hypothetical protein
MTDIYHQFGSDLQISPTGDLAPADGATLTQQRILRRLLTNQGDYIWQLKYGGGLASFIGDPVKQNAILGVVIGQLSQEATVANNPAPTVTLATDQNGGVFLTIQYVYLPTGTTQVLSVPVGG